MLTEKVLATVKTMPSLSTSKRTMKRNSPKADIFTITRSAKVKKRLIKDDTSLKSIFIKHFRNYCDNSSLHGVYYITKPGLSKWERRFWVTVVCLSLLSAVILVWVNWIQSQKTRTVTLLETTFYPTSNVNFPAITLCNFNKISKKKALELAKTLKKPSSINDTELANLFKVTINYSFGMRGNNTEFQILDSILKTNEMSWDGLLSYVQPNCLDMAIKCFWKGSDTRCDGLFQTINSSEGTCCSFNYYGLEKNNYPT